MRQIEALAARATTTGGGGGTTRGSMDMSVLSMGSVGGVSASNAFVGGNVSTRSSMDLTMQLTEDPVFHDLDETVPESQSQPQAQTMVPSFTTAVTAATATASISAASQPQATTIANAEALCAPCAPAASMAPWSAPNSFGMTATAPSAQVANPFGTANDMSSQQPQQQPQQQSQQQQPPTNSFGGSSFGGFPSSGSFPSNGGFPSMSFGGGVGGSGPETSFASSSSMNTNPFASFPSASPAFPTSASYAAPSSSFGSAPSGTANTMMQPNANSNNNNNHLDLSHDYTHETQSASTDDALYVQKGGPNWDLALFRLANLDNIHDTLEFILTDVDLYEAAELYISTIGSYHHDHVGPDGGDGDDHSPRDHDNDEDDDRDRNEHEAELHAHELTMHLQLLRGWKRYQQHPEDTEGLLMGLEEVLGLEQEEITDHLSDAVRHNEAKLQQIFNDMAYALVPEFILSSDFEAYFETHSPVKAHNKKLRIDSKSWLGKFQKVANDHSVPCHLFLGSGGTDHRPYANNKMRTIFGPMCDAPSPREYIDPGHNDPAAVQAFLQAMKEGQDVMTALICRTMKNGRPPALLAVKHMHSYKHPELIKYSLVVYHDMSQPDAERKLKVVQALLKSLP